MYRLRPRRRPAGRDESRPASSCGPGQAGHRYRQDQPRIDTDWRLGNTGAAAVFVQMALDVMGRHIEGGVSAAVDLRDPAGAGIVFIGPPTDAMRKAQDGRASFKHRVQPAIDPADYR